MCQPQQFERGVTCSGSNCTDVAIKTRCNGTYIQERKKLK